MSDAMCNELATVGELLEAQVAAGQSRDDVMECMFRSWLARLATGPTAGSKQKASLTQAITSGPWTAEQRKELAATVLGGNQRKAASKARRPNQKAHMIENLVPMSVMLKLKDTSKYSVTSRLSILAGAARSLGLELLDNKTLYRMVALVAFQEGNYDMSQEQVWQHMTTLQTFLQNSVRVPGVEFLAEYPPTAELLPDDIKQAAYGSGELPPELNLADLDTVLGGTKMRGGRRVSGKNKGKDEVPSVPPLDAPTVLASAAASSVLPAADVFRFRADSKIIDEAKPPAPKIYCESCSKMVPAPHADDHAKPDLKPDDEEDDGMAIDSLGAFEKSMIGAYEVRKKPGCKSEPKPKAKSSSKSMAKASSAGLAMKLVLGCGKCRGSPGGCGTCRNPAFKGRRGPSCGTPKKKTMKSMSVKKTMKSMAMKGKS